MRCTPHGENFAFDHYRDLNFSRISNHSTTCSNRNRSFRFRSLRPTLIFGSPSPQSRRTEVVEIPSRLASSSLVSNITTKLQTKTRARCLMIDGAVKTPSNSLKFYRYSLRNKITQVRPIRFSRKNKAEFFILSLNG